MKPLSTRQFFTLTTYALLFALLSTTGFCDEKEKQEITEEPPEKPKWEFIERDGRKYVTAEDIGEFYQFSSTEIDPEAQSVVFYSKPRKLELNTDQNHSEIKINSIPVTLFDKTIWDSELKQLLVSTHDIDNIITPLIRPSHARTRNEGGPFSIVLAGDETLVEKLNQEELIHGIESRGVKVIKAGNEEDAFRIKIVLKREEDGTNPNKVTGEWFFDHDAEEEQANELAVGYATALTFYASHRRNIEVERAITPLELPDDAPAPFDAVITFTLNDSFDSFFDLRVKIGFALEIGWTLQEEKTLTQVERAPVQDEPMQDDVGENAPKNEKADQPVKKKPHTNWEKIEHEGKTYVTSEDIKKFYQFQRFSQDAEKQSAFFQHRSATLLLNSSGNHKEIKVNNIRFALIGNTVWDKKNERLLLSTIDLALVLDPIVRPSYIKIKDSAVKPGQPTFFDRPYYFTLEGDETLIKKFDLNQLIQEVESRGLTTVKKQDDIDVIHIGLVFTAQEDATKPNQVSTRWFWKTKSKETGNTNTLSIALGTSLHAYLSHKCDLEDNVLLPRHIEEEIQNPAIAKVVFDLNESFDSFEKINEGIANAIIKNRTAVGGHK